MTTDNFCFYLQNQLIQTSQTGGQQYSDTSPFSIPWFEFQYHIHWESALGQKAATLSVAELTLAPCMTPQQLETILFVVSQPKEPRTVFTVLHFLCNILIGPIS